MKAIDVSNDILLRPVSLDDAEEIFSTIDRERKYLGKWLRFVEQTNDPADTRRFIESVMVWVNGPADIVYSIKYQGHFAGLIGFKFTDSLNRKTEIGYWISEPFQGKGIVTQAVRALINQAFDQWGFHRIQINVATGNQRSKRIPKNLGFTLEGIARSAELLSEGYTDIEMYSLLKNEWKG